MSLHQERINKVAEYLKNNPEANKVGAIKALGITPSAYYASVKKLEKKNGRKTKVKKTVKGNWRKKSQKMLTLEAEAPITRTNRVVVLIGLPKDVFETLQGLNF